MQKKTSKNSHLLYFKNSNSQKKTAYHVPQPRPLPQVPPLNIPATEESENTNDRRGPIQRQPTVENPPRPRTSGATRRTNRNRAGDDEANEWQSYLNQESSGWI